MREKEEEDRPAPSPSPRSVHSGDGQVGWLTYLWYGAPSHSRSKGWAPRDLLLAGPAGRVWGPSPTPSLSSLLPVAVRCQIPAPASPDPGVGPRAPPPRPTFQGSPGRSTRWIQSPLAQLGPPRWRVEAGRRSRDTKSRERRLRRRGNWEFEVCRHAK
jgi:hypothetical protein